MKTISKPIIFLPVESTPRELDYKVNLARLFCNNGFEAILGNPPFIRDELKYKNYKGAFLEKGGNPDPDYYQKIAENGILLYCLSDEGASFPAFSVTYPLAVKTLKSMKSIFLWGDFQKNDLIKRNDDPVLAEKYQVTGYPGIEFSQPFYKDYHEALKPKSLPSSYILVNTNFGSHNGFGAEEIHKACNAMSPETAEQMEESYKKEALTFQHFSARLTELIKSFPNEIFVIRPHPAEREEAYVKHFGCYENVIVSKKGNVNQIISSAKLVIHSDCTTALQSYLMGVSVISLAYPYNDMIPLDWPLSFGAVPDSMNDVKNLVDYVLKNKSLPKFISKKVDESAQIKIKEMFGGIENCSGKIVSTMLEGVNSNFKNMRPYKLHDSRAIVQKIKVFIRKFLPLHYKVPLASRLLLQSYTRPDIEKRINLLNEMEEVYSKYSVKKIFPNTFHIKKI